MRFGPVSGLARPGRHTALNAGKIMSVDKFSHDCKMGLWCLLCFLQKAGFLFRRPFSFYPYFTQAMISMKIYRDVRGVLRIRHDT